MAKKSSKKVIEWRRRTKIRAVEYLGGKCSKCGYDRCIRALSFHHRNPRLKKFGLSISTTRSWSSIKAELDKCDLLCMNCHMEVEHQILLGCRGIGRPTRLLPERAKAHL